MEIVLNKRLVTKIIFNYQKMLAKKFCDLAAGHPHLPASQSGSLSKGGVLIVLAGTCFGSVNRSTKCHFLCEDFNHPIETTIK